MSERTRLLRHVLHSGACLALVSACATPPTVDNSPEVATAVTVAKVRNLGFRGFFASDGEETLWTMPDRQRRDHAYKLTGQVPDFFAPREDVSQIVRLDDRLRWSLDNRKQRYRQCELSGCRGNFELPGVEPDFDDEDAVVYDESECIVKPVRNDLDVIKTGERRIINGFSTEEYRVTWTMVVVDQKERTTRNVVSSTVWTTNDGDLAAQAGRIRNSFEAAHVGATKTTTLTPLGRAFPPEAMTIVQENLIDTLPRDMQAWVTDAAMRAPTIEGLPISTKVTWSARAEACGEAKMAVAEERDRLQTDSVTGLLSSMGEQILDQKPDAAKEREHQQIALKTVFAYVREVQSVTIQPVRMSKMQVPGGYTLDP